MGAGYKFGEPVEAESGLRLARRWRILLAHDATATTCDPLVDAIEGALGNVDINESSSIDDAQVALRTSRFDVCLVCLDLPPAPLGGVRLAQEVMKRGVPVVLVTRSLRWIPPSAQELREVPWVSPDAGAAEVARAVGEAVAALGIGAWPEDGSAPASVRQPAHDDESDAVAEAGS